MWDWLDTLWSWGAGIANDFWQWMTWLYQEMEKFVKWALDTFKNFFGWLGKGFQWIFRHLAALRHLNFTSIWRALKRAYNRLNDLRNWLKKNYWDPINNIRNQIMDVYNRFFRPIIRFLDSLRVLVRIIAIFNRRLAAQLDRALFDLEAKIMYPITTALHRLNEISSYMRAYFTVLGYLDRVTLLESLRRDAGLAWEILTNPRALVYDTVKPTPKRTVADSVSDFKVWAKTGGGPTGDYVEHARQVFRDALGGVS